MSTLVFLITAMATLPFSNGRWMSAAAAFIGPAMLTLFIRRFDQKKGLLYGYLILTITSLVSWFTVNNVVSGPQIYFGVLFWLIAILIPYAADRFFRPVGDSAFLKTLFLPMAWVSVDMLFSLLLADSGSIAYSQFENLPLLQLASITGMAGITFMIAWTASTVSWLFENRTRLKSVRAGIYLFLFVAGGILEFGMHRLSTQPPEGGELIPVAAITSNAIEKPSTELLLKKSLNAHETGARLILWSEALAANFDGLKEFTEKNNVYVFAAAGIQSEAGLLDNKVVLFDPGGEEALTYRKHNLAPGERSIPGEKTFRYLDTLSGRFGVAICADLNYSHFMRAAGKNGIDILFEPAAEWPEVARIQTAVALMRAVENGFNLVKATKSGHSVVTDFTGRILAQTEKPEEETLIASVPNRGSGTIYSVGGWLFGYLVLTAFLIVLALKLKDSHFATIQK